MANGIIKKRHYINENTVFKDSKFTVIDIPYDLIIGMNYFQMFGFVLSGIPVKLPESQVTGTDELIPPIDIEALKAPFD
jgi:hypothetical protein